MEWNQGRGKQVRGREMRRMAGWQGHHLRARNQRLHPTLTRKNDGAISLRFHIQARHSTEAFRRQPNPDIASTFWLRRQPCCCRLASSTIMEKEGKGRGCRHAAG